MTESLTNMEAVKPRGPKLFVAGLALAAAGSVAWFFLGREQGPAGAPEDPSKVMLIAAEDPTPPLMGQLGFTVERRDLAEAAAEGRSLGSERADDIEAVLHLADVQGFGYVAFADAGTLDFGQRSVSADSATIPEDRRYAVFSVGDLAPSGPKVTVDPNPRRYDLPPYVELLRALFEQDKLAATLVGETNLSIEARPLFGRVEAAVRINGAYGMVEHKARAASERLEEYVVHSEEGTPKPEVLTEGIERTHGYALANGSVLLLVDAAILENPKSDDVSLDWTGDTRAWVLAPETGERSRCEVGDRLRPTSLALQAHGAAILSAWGGEELMVWTVDADAPGCALSQAGTVGAGAAGWGHADGRGKVARAAAGEDGVIAEIHTPDADHPQTWPLTGCTAATHPIWLDATHLAAACEYRPAAPTLWAEEDLDVDPGDAAPPDPAAAPPIPLQRWLYILSVEDGSVLALPLSEAHRANPELWLRPSEGGLQLLTTGPEGLMTYTFDAKLDDVFSEPALDASRPQPAFVADASAGVRALRADAAVASPVAMEAPPTHLEIAPDGARAAFPVDRGSEFEQNLAVYDFATKSTRRVAVNEWGRHFGPSFSANGTLVFNTTYSTKDWGRATVAQRVSLR